MKKKRHKHHYSVKTYEYTNHHIFYYTDRKGYTYINQYQNDSNGLNIDEDSAKIGPIIQRILYGSRRVSIGQKYIANHHFDTAILKEYNNASYEI